MTDVTDVQIPKAALGPLVERWTPKPDYAGDPRLWWEKRAEPRGVWLWSRQLEILEALTVHPQVAVKSCHSAGKSFDAAAAAAWWLDAHPVGEAFVVTSAPTGDQVKAILWREINRMHKKLGLAGRTNLTEWYVGDEIVAFGRKPNDYEPTAFQGIHARYVLVILDEACGIPMTLWDAASSLTSNENGRILAIGNPDDPMSHFAKVCGMPTWHVIKVSAYDTPNFTDEVVPDYLHDLLVSRRWVEEKKQEWGVGSPLYTSKVEGEFPTDATDGVIPFSWATKCRWLDLDPDAEGGPTELGLDPARGGGDRAVCWLRVGRKAVRQWVWPYTPDPKDLAEKVLVVIQDTGASSVKVDADGLGWGITGILDVFHEEGLHDAIAVPVFGSARADDDEHFLNKRAEVWWAARERSRLEEWDLSALDDSDVQELTEPRYHTQNPRSRIQIEKKEDLGKRLGRSPDSADALLLAFHEEVWEVESFVDQVTRARIPG